MALTEWPTKTPPSHIQRAAEFDHVVGVAVERGVLLRVVGREVGAAGADVVEQERAELALEGGSHEAPHVLVAAEAVGEDHRPGDRPRPA